MLTEGVEPYIENKKRSSEILKSEEPGPLTGTHGTGDPVLHRSKKPTLEPSYLPESSHEEMQALWEQQRQKDAQNLVLQKKLSHYRSWTTSLQNKVQQQNPQAVKNAKRLYVGGFPSGTGEDDLRTFLCELMKKTGGCSMPGSPILSIRIMKDKNFAFAEFRSVEETVNATALDGVAYENTRLKIRRPSNYDINSAMLLGPLTPDPTMNVSGLDICRSTVEDSPHKLFIGGLPYEYREEQVRELVGAYAAVKSFNLVMDRATGKSKGYAFCELVDESSTDFVIQQLNSQRVENKLLTVKRAMEGSKNSNSTTLQSMMTSVLHPNGASTISINPTGAAFPSDLSSSPYPTLHHPYGGASTPTPTPTQSIMAAPRPYSVLGLTGMNTVGSNDNLLGGGGNGGATPLSNGSLQSNNMMTQLANHGQRPSSMISQISTLTNGSTTDALPGSYGSFGCGNSVVGGGGGGNNTFGLDFKVDPDFLGHDISQSLGNTCLQTNRTLDDQQQGLHVIENPGNGSLW